MAELRWSRVNGASDLSARIMKAEGYRGEDIYAVAMITASGEWDLNRREMQMLQWRMRACLKVMTSEEWLEEWRRG